MVTTSPIPAVPERLLTELDRLLTPDGALGGARVLVLSGPAGHDKTFLLEAWFAAHPDITRIDVTGPDDLTDVASGEGNRVLVVQGAELLDDAELVRRVLELAESGCGLRALFAGRTRPRSPLGSLSARGLLVDIDASHLAWTREDVRRAFATSGQEVGEEVLDLVMAETRGWPMAVRLLTGQPFGPSQLVRTRRVMGEYLDEAALQDVSPADMDLLLRLAPLPALEPAAANWLGGRPDAAAQCSRLQAQGLPLTWDDDNAIRLNPLLRIHLLARHRQEDPEAARENSRRAVIWLRHRGSIEDALTVASDAGLEDLVWALVAEFVTSNLHRPLLKEQLGPLVAKLPPGWPRELVRSFDAGTTAPQSWIAQLETIDPSMVSGLGETGRMARICLVLATARQIDYPAKKLLDDAVAEALEVADLPVDELQLALHTCLRTELGLWLLHHGRMDEASRILMAALGGARLVDSPWAVATCLGALGLAHALRGHSVPAAGFAQQALDQLEATPLMVETTDEYALLALATVHGDRGELDEAREYLEKVARNRTPGAENLSLYTCLQGRLALAERNPQTALRLAEVTRLGAMGTTGSPWHSYLARGTAFLAHLELGQFPRAEAVMDELVANEVVRRYGGEPLVRALMAMAVGDARTAHDELAPRLDSLEQNPLTPKLVLYELMVFGRACEQLGLAAEAMEALERAGVLAEQLGLQAPGAAHTALVGARDQEVVELTPAEQKVLAHLSSEMTLTETANAMFISVNTLKTHLRKIYRKLGVDGRQQAIERAKLLGIRPRLGS